MRIARFTTVGEDPRYGILDDEDFVVLAGDPMFAGLDTTGERVPIPTAKLLAPVIPRSKVIVVGRDGVVYLKPNTAVIGPGDAIQLPPGEVTASGALAVVIGSIAKRVRAADAAGVIFGYSIGVDVAASEQIATGQPALARGYDSFAPLGPVMETEFDTPENVAAEVERVSGVWTLLPGDVIMLDLGEEPEVLQAGAPFSVTVAGLGTLTNPVRAR
ncbi:MAG: fumarylacetoacetate hydrolase family protein [Actinomycetota bacterium]